MPPWYPYWSYWSDYFEQYHRAERLEQEKTQLSNEKRELERQLAEKTGAAQVSSAQVFTLGHKVRELERQNTGLSGALAKQREDTRKAGLLFMDAADRYQEEAKKTIRAKAEELASTRKAGLVLMNTADAYQEAARKQAKEKAEELEGARKAVLVLMEVADAYQREAKKKIRDLVEEMKVVGAQKAEMDERVQSLELELKEALAKNRELEGDYGKVKDENEKLRLEVERFMMEIGALAPEEKYAAAKAFNADKEEILMELEDFKMKVKTTRINLMEGENDKLQLDALVS